MQVQFLNLILIVTTLSMATTRAADGHSFKITAKRDTDRVEVGAENDKPVISVRSPVGISQIVIERTTEKWSDKVMLRLHLEGLENLRITNGKNTIEAAVSSQNGKVRFLKDGNQDSPLNSTHPYWLEIRMVGRNGKPVKTIPLKDGYFEMYLPRALFDDNPKSITVSWIDFYR